MYIFLLGNSGNPSPCISSNQCSHSCVVGSSNSSVCTCPNGMTLYAGEKRCKDDKLKIHDCKFFCIINVLQYLLRFFASNVYKLGILDLFARKEVTCTDCLVN